MVQLFTLRELPLVVPMWQRQEVRMLIELRQAATFQTWDRFTQRTWLLVSNIPVEWMARLNTQATRE